MEKNQNSDELKQKNLVLFLKDFNLTEGEQVLFKNFFLDVFEDEIIGFFAPTGTGKTSLFNHIANTADVGPEPVAGLSISYVFQEPRLIPSLTVLKNVMLPLENKMNEKAAKDLAIEWLTFGRSKFDFSEARQLSLYLNNHKKTLERINR